MRLTYDVEADALDIALLPDAKSARTVRLSPDVPSDKRAGASQRRLVASRVFSQGIHADGRWPSLASGGSGKLDPATGAWVQPIINPAGHQLPGRPRSSVPATPTRRGAVQEPVHLPRMLSRCT